MTSRFALDKMEKDVLYRKYRAIGFSTIDAYAEIKRFCNFLRELKGKLLRKKSPEEINERFKREFEKLCQEIDGRRG